MGGQQGYEDDEYTAVFAGVAPISDPDLVLVVGIDSPQGKEYYGGEVAAPVFSRIMEQSLRMRQVAPDDGKMPALQVAGGAQTKKHENCGDVQKNKGLRMSKKEK